MKTFLYLGLFTLVMPTFLSCNGKKVKDVPNNIEYDSIAVSKTYHLNNDTTQSFCYLKINYLYPVKYANTDILAKIQKDLNIAFLEGDNYAQLSQADAINKYIADYIENYKKEIELRQTRWEESEDDVEYSFSYSKILSNRVLFDKDALLVYQIKAIDYKSNTDTLTSYRNIVIDLKTGNQLTESDIFIPDYKKALNTIIINEIVSQNNALKPDDLFELGYWGIEDLASNNNFYIDNNGLTYIFNQGEYTARRLGDIRVFLPYKKIAHLLKSDSPISVLLDN